MLKNNSILETIALGLGDMLDQFVFVGGSVIELYATPMPLLMSAKQMM
jgi:hypothetical protein